MISRCKEGASFALLREAQSLLSGAELEIDNFRQGALLAIEELLRHTGEPDTTVVSMFSSEPELP